MIRARSAAAALTAAFLAVPAPAQPISVQDSFRLGSGGVLCTAQSAATAGAFSDMFDRVYAIVCRDASVPVGRLYALRERGGDPTGRLAALRSGIACGPADAVELEGLSGAEAADCRIGDSGVTYRVYSVRQRGTLYVAEGLGGYDSALRLGLRTVVADRPVPGEVEVAITGAGDSAAFARAQAGSLDPQRALIEAYRRNYAGNYAEAAEFFATLLAADRAGADRSEAMANEALQHSNLGRYAEADAAFARAQAIAAADPAIARMLRNYRAMHQMNQGRPAESLAELGRPLPDGADRAPAALHDLIIDADTAARFNADDPIARQLSASSARLTLQERVQILDGQAQHLRGTAARLLGRHAEAETTLGAALDELAAVREGRVTSTIWMRAQIHGELAAVAEQRGDLAGAERQHDAAVALLAGEHPGSPAMLSAKGRLAAFHARNGRTGPALALYREIVESNADSGNASPTLRRALAPYFALLAADGHRPEAAADLFKASQILVRPGVAQTQAVLARELSGGSDEAARLFRQSVNLTREVERARIEIARLEGAAAPTGDQAARLERLRAELSDLESAQVETQAGLTQFPRYRVVSGGAMSLAELQQLLRPGEAYYKMATVGDNIYALFATQALVRAYRIEASPAQLDAQVNAVRATIARVEDGQTVTYPFDVERAHTLYRQLFGPVEAEFAAVRHLIFEPDGAMLRLPPNLLVAGRKGVEAYRRKAATPGSDEFDFTGIAWLGRDKDVSTAVSARSFRDVRQVAPSSASNAYIGFGENSPASSFFLPASGSRSVAAGDDCSWSLAEWNRPVSSDELFTAARALRGGGAEIVTGEEFTDTAIRNRGDLHQYRILHFATHGLLEAPRPECPARPALMTSFGGEQSNGLLTFRDIFDLRIDADLVILSACDTAGRASASATREAGLATGGDFALDGLVRAFVGAGGRLVVASHWPVPDDFNATSRLISGLFTAPAGTATATALRTAQLQMMDEPETSHPYYWSGFAVVGDGMLQVIPASR